MTGALGGPAPAQAMARSGAFSLVGSMTSAFMGLLLTVAIGRLLGTSGAGVLLQAIAAFTIALSVAKAGLTTTAVWLLPRVADEDVAQVRPALVGLLLPSAGIGVLAGLLMYAGGDVIDPQGQGVAQSLHALAWVLPFGTVMIVALSATRGLGGVRPFVLINSIAVPTLRVLLVVLVTSVSAGTLGATIAWAAPLPFAAVVSVLLVARNVGRREHRANAPRRWGPSRSLQRRIWGYALPRSVSGILEQALNWLNVLLVGLLASPAGAGIYGAASRFVGAGLILNTAMVIVVAPLYSRSLGLGRVAEAQSAYRTTTQWIVLFSMPIYLIFVGFGGTVMSILGDEFRRGADTLLILSLGLMVVLLTGNIQSVLLMSGRSGLAAGNKAVALAVDVSLVFVLVPVMGIQGAAVAWGLSVIIDAGLAAYQVQRLVGIQVLGRSILFAAVVPLAAFGLPGTLMRVLMGDTLKGLVISCAMGVVLWVATAFLFRRQLELAAITSMLNRGGPRP